MRKPVCGVQIGKQGDKAGLGFNIPKPKLTYRVVNRKSNDASTSTKTANQNPFSVVNDVNEDVSELKEDPKGKQPVTVDGGNDGPK